MQFNCWQKQNSLPYFRQIVEIFYVAFDVTLKLVTPKSLAQLKRRQRPTAEKEKSGFPSVNFANILRAAFRTKVFRAAFLYLQLRFIFFWQKEIGAKTAHKMLVKLTPDMSM